MEYNDGALECDSCGTFVAVLKCTEPNVQEIYTDKKEIEIHLCEKCYKLSLK